MPDDPLGEKMFPNIQSDFKGSENLQSGDGSSIPSCHMAGILLGMCLGSNLAVPAHGLCFCISTGVLDGPVGTSCNHSSFFTEQTAAQYQNQTDLFS